MTRPVFHQPPDGWLADVIPFFWDGRFHLFYLKDSRDVPLHGTGTPWFHLVTTDHATFEDLGEAIPRGGDDAQDQFVHTGSVLERDGLFHIFYQLRIEPARGRIVFDRWPRPGNEPFVFERPLPGGGQSSFRLRVLVDK